MYLLNFGHPITAAQITQITEAETLRMATVTDFVPFITVVTVPVSITFDRQLTEQVVEITDAAGLSPDEWQAGDYIVNLPGMSMAAGLLMAEIHGRSGIFPRVVLLRRAEAGGFEVWDIVDAQSQRDAARSRRFA